MSHPKAPAIGIDLGTSYCSVGVFENGKVTILANDQGIRRTPSSVLFKGTARLIGESWASLAGRNALRLIGLKFEDPLVQDFRKRSRPFIKVISDDEGRPKFAVDFNRGRKLFFPEEICSMFLEKLKETAEKYLGRPVTDAVVTVPVDFNYSQRQAIRDAVRVAGMNAIGIISAPVAAAIAQYFPVSIPKVGERPSGSGTEKRNVLVFDLGGGSLDVSILTIVNNIFEVKSSVGNCHLGGEDFVNRMVKHCVKGFKTKYKSSIPFRKVTLSRLRNACEVAKKNLSGSTEAFLKHFCSDYFPSSISCSLFEEINADLFNNVLEPVEKCLRDAMMDKSEIDDVVLVGGSTRIPKIRQLLQEFFDGKELKIMENCEEASAFGAALHAAVLSGDRSEEIKNLLLLDAIPISFGVETTEGEMVMVTVIKQHAVMSSKWIEHLKIFTGNQRILKIKVYEGKAEEENTLIGELEFPEFFPVLSQVHVKVAFELDEQGILRVTATEMFTGELNEVKVTFDKGSFTLEEIECMVNDAEAFKKAEAEMQRRRLELERSMEAEAIIKQEAADPVDFEIDQPEPLNNPSQDADFAIVCGSGAEIKCHKAFLSEKSEILRAMIETGTEAVTNRIEMADLGEESVKAFLAFLYHRDTTEASENSGVAFELLRGAHKYDLKDLQSETKKMILAKGTSWFRVDDAVRLFAFARKLENGEDLKIKAVEVLKKNISTLDDSDCFKELFQSDPESVMDLYQCSISS